MAFAREGYFFIAVATVLALTGFVIAAILGSWTAWLSAYLLVILAIFIAFFFRDPERQGERGEHLIVAPADGRVVQITSGQEPTYVRGPATRISIFLSLFNVHVQRAPVSGMVEYRHHMPGRFRAAWEERASFENEQSSTGIWTGDSRILVRQIAGLVAQRIETYVEEGDTVEQGDRIGIIRFGSRVDTFVPRATRLRVRVGDRVYGGRSVLGEMPEGVPRDSLQRQRSP